MRRDRIWMAAAWIVLGAACLGCLPEVELEMEIPGPGDWTDCGPVLRAGAPGAWDHLLYGGFAGSAIKKGRRILLYYQGAAGHRADGDQTPLRRAVGVAISKDGLRFRKHRANPVLTWQPNRGPEEGAAAATATLDDRGRVLLFYGANTESGDPSRMQVNADVRIARSRDGVHFRDLGIVLDHGSPDVWGAGDELFPLAVVRHDSGWILYYVPNGTTERGRLGAAWGDRPDRLHRTGRVRGPFGAPIPVWGMASAIPIGPGHWALVTSRVREGSLDVHLVDPDRPRQSLASGPFHAFDPPSQGTVLLDRARGRWLLYQRRGGAYHAYVAPLLRAGERPAPDPVSCTGPRGRRRPAP